MLPEDNKKAILATLLYSDIFDYPLTNEEIYAYIIKEKQINNLFISHQQVVSSKDNNRSTINSELRNYEKIQYGRASLTKKNDFFCIKGREFVIAKRIKRKKISERKIAIAQKIVRIMKHIPTIKLIGLSGSVAIENADEGDDIDFFIITKTGTVWLTRLLVICLLQLFRVRRRRNDTHAKNKICVNMLIDVQSLGLNKSRQDLYTAHEVIQMKSLFSRKNIYELFLQNNMWVLTYLPNAFHKKNIMQVEHQKEVNQPILNVLEIISRKIQLWYMRQHKTTEITTNSMLAFHPIDYRNIVLKEFKKRLQKYEI